MVQQMKDFIPWLEETVIELQRAGYDAEADDWMVF